MTVPVHLRRCPRCERSLPVDAFPPRANGTRRHCYCRACKAAYQREWYERNRERHLAAVREDTTARRRQLSEYLGGLKSVACADCRRRFPPEVMDFDHVRGQKARNVSQLRLRVGAARLEAEIAKCEVVCANCHRQRTYGVREE
jgi:hypothetical protein